MVVSRRKFSYSALVLLSIVILVALVSLLIVNLTGKATLQTEPSSEINSVLSGQATITIDKGDSIQKDTQINIVLLKDDVVLSETTRTFEEFLGNQISYVELTNENGTGYYYQTPGEYSRNLNEFIDYTFTDSGDYVLRFSIPSLNINEESAFNIPAPSKESPADELSALGEGDVGAMGISSCPVLISSSNVLSDDIPANLASGQACINITADDVVLDCQGHGIISLNSGIGEGIDITNRDNITIKNCSVSDFSTGIYLYNSTHSKILNNNIFSNKFGGVSLVWNSSYNIFANNTISSTTYGSGIGLILTCNYNNITSNTLYDNGEPAIEITKSTGNSIILNNASQNPGGGITIGEYSDGNTIASNTLNGNGNNIFLLASSGNTFTNNTATNGNYGLHMESYGPEGCNSNTFLNNTFNNNNYGIGPDFNPIATGYYNKFISTTANNNKYGMYFYYAGYNTIINSTLNNNSRYGIYFDHGTHNNITNLNADSNNVTFYLSGGDSNRFLNVTSVNSTVWDIYSTGSSDNLVTNLTANQNLVSFTYNDIALKGMTTGSADPLNYANISKYINATNLSASSWLNINFSYSHSDITNAIESSLSVWKNNASGWVQNGWNGTRVLDTVNNVVGVNITSFGSTFAPLGQKSAIDVCPYTITIPNQRYTLANNINRSADDCVTISASNVTLDCLGYNITNVNFSISFSTGISVANQVNVTIKNCGVYNFSSWRGIGFANTNRSIISNNTIGSNFWGIFIDSGFNNNISNNNANSNEYGIEIYGGSRYNIIANNNVSMSYRSGSVQGIAVVNSLDNNVTNNDVSSNNYTGIYVYDSNNTIIASNTVLNNTQYGIYIDTSEYGISTNNKIFDNTIKLNGVAGIRFYQAFKNRIYNNLFNNIANILISGAQFDLNYFNTTQTSATNIISGSTYGGNFWAEPDGTGCSQTCVDNGLNGICDTNCTLATGAAGDSIDWLPLSDTDRISLLPRTINASGSYFLGTDLTVNATGITINVSNVEIDCGGFLINYSNTTAGYAIYALNQTNITIKNCKVTQGSSSVFGLPALYFANVSIGRIEYNNITTIGSTSPAVSLEQSRNVNISGNIIKTSGSSSYGIWIQAGSTLNNLVQNNISVTGNPGYCIYIWDSNSTTLSYNTIRTTASSNFVRGIHLYGSSHNRFVNNSIYSSADSWDYYSRPDSTINSINNTAVNMTLLRNNVMISFRDYHVAIKSMDVGSVPADLAGYNNIAKYLNITNNTADGWIYLNISYTNTDVTAASVAESTLKIYKYNNTAWVLANTTSSTNGVDTTNKFVYTNITSFGSTFGVFGLEVDIINPAISIVYPTATNYTTNVSALNYTVSDSNLDKCWYSLNLGVTNTTITCGTNKTDLTSTEGYNTWKVYANDTLGNQNVSSVTFFKDTIYPLIGYGTGTEVDNANKSQSDIYINTTWTEINFKNITFRYNSSLAYTSTSPIYLYNNLGLADGVYNYNVTICDSSNNCNTTATRTITLDTTNPAVSIVYPTAINYSTNVSELNYTVSDIHLQACWYSINNGVTNTTLTCGTNKTALTSIEGSNTWKVYANDSAGNLGVSSITFSKDTVYPLIIIISPVNNSWYNSGIFDVSINEDGTCRYSLDNGVLNRSMSSSNSRNFNATNSTIAEGNNYNVTYYCNDTVGHLNISSVIFFNIDKAAPSVFLGANPIDGYSATGTTTLSFEYNVTDYLNISLCALVLNGIIFAYNSSAVTNETNSITDDISAGSYSWSVNCTDEAGNIANSSTRSLTINSAASTGGGGGGGGGGLNTYSPSEVQFSQGYNAPLKNGEAINFVLNSGAHSLSVSRVGANFVDIVIRSNPTNLRLFVGDSVKLNLTQGDYYDLYVKLESIVSGKASITIKSIYEMITSGGQNEPGEANVGGAGGENPPIIAVENKGIMSTLLVVIIFLSILVLVGILLMMRKKNSRRGLETKVEQDVEGYISGGLSALKAHKIGEARKYYKLLQAYYDEYGSQLSAKERNKLYQRIISFYSKINIQ